MIWLLHNENNGEHDYCFSGLLRIEDCFFLPLVDGKPLGPLKMCKGLTQGSILNTILGAVYISGIDILPAGISIIIQRNNWGCLEIPYNQYISGRFFIVFWIMELFIMGMHAFPTNKIRSTSIQNKYCAFWDWWAIIKFVPENAWYSLSFLATRYNLAESEDSNWCVNQAILARETVTHTMLQLHQQCVHLTSVSTADLPAKYSLENNVPNFPSVLFPKEITEQPSCITVYLH